MLQAIAEDQPRVDSRALKRSEPKLCREGARIGRLLTEHPAWRPTQGGCVRAFPGDVSTIVVTTGQEGWSDSPLDSSAHLQREEFSLPSNLEAASDELTANLHEMGPITRFRNPDLWDALGTGVIRQVIRAAQSKRMYRAFCDMYGPAVRVHDGSIHHVFPTAETVLALSDEAFGAAGMAFKMRPLRHAASAYMTQRESWTVAEPKELIDLLCAVPGIGPWTARAAVADYTNDWSLYPIGDLAVRTWVRRADPKRGWPTDEAEFAAAWRGLAGPSLSDLTLLVLAWGSLQGDIG